MKITLLKAIELLAADEVVALPTETVYGLAARFDSIHAVSKVFKLKNRPKSNPLIIHLADQKELDPFVAAYPPDFKKLAEAFWPGPLTFILPVKDQHLLPAVCAGLKTAAFRMPANPLTLQILKAIGPLVMPSANLSGRPSSTSAAHVEADFGADFPVLDGGMCVKGLESTILHFHDNRWVIARLGSLSAEKLEKVLGYIPLNMAKSDRVIAPGQFFRHYAPRAALKLDKSEQETAPYILGFKERLYPSTARVILMGSLDDSKEVAENLYRILRLLDEENAAWAWVDMDFPSVDLWVTIRERLQRAASN